MKALIAGACIVVVLSVWFGGWYLYEEYALYSENMTPSKFTNVLVVTCVGSVISVLVSAHKYSRWQEQNYAPEMTKTERQAKRGLRQRREKENPNLQTLSDKIDSLREFVKEQFESVESSIEDTRIAQSLAPETKRKEKA